MSLPPRFIKVELLRRGVTLREIAEYCGVHHTVVSHVVAGRRTTRAVRERIAKIIELPVETVFGPDKQNAA
jgi:transcriptional regulator with XRE-family HTH domain